MIPKLEQMTVAQRIEYYHERKQSRDADGRPRVTDCTGYEFYDPLLEALISAHGRPRRDLYPGTHD